MKKTKPTTKTDPAPDMKWQAGPYKRLAQFHFILPNPFLLLCRLMEVTPETLLLDFMSNLGCESANRQSREAARQHLMEYFIAHGYGQQYYTEEQIRQVFKEMDAVGLLFPRHDDDMIDAYVLWREKHQRSWFKKWFQKPRRPAG
ncbi:hypothetical protein A8C56_17170 [Niabella ginsenosidivorans]|uniref:Uncharacterized protein n=1 Tax=Niabella ginsenosidivorans TaxID=1176587 RepID=A0A1A9I5Y9_9BACT|nr:hypothetical protein [Niabella ginsenosidivorans]ANH82469.1 hypothetical protein A8C56_17170 [Niabella ginsenosidivorans]